MTHALSAQLVGFAWAHDVDTVGHPLVLRIAFVRLSCTPHWGNIINPSRKFVKVDEYTPFVILMGEQA